MRRYIKKQCFDTLILLEEAQSEIKNYIERHEDEAAVELLGQCQEGAGGQRSDQSYRRQIRQEERQILSD